jgi:hypothetical protein
MSIAFKNGDPIVIVGRDDQFDGQEGTYVGPDGGGGRCHVMVGGADLYFFDRHIQHRVKPSEETGIITDLQAKVERLNNEVAEHARRATRAEERLAEQQRHYSHDMGAIYQIMVEQKSEQDWCNDGFNSVVRDVNAEMEGGWSFEEWRPLVKKSVNVKGTTTVDMDVWVVEGDDEDDPDNWRDEDGDEISDTDEAMQDALKAEFEGCCGFDDVEVN